MFLNRHSITQEISSYQGYLKRLPFARYPGMLHDIMRLHTVFVMVLPFQHHIDKTQRRAIARPMECFVRR